jgi:hypothetical protein
MESDIRKCKVCLELKHRRLVGKFDSRNKRYDDETGKSWRGNICPVCHKEDIKRRMQAMRVLRKSLK